MVPAALGDAADGEEVPPVLPLDELLAPDQRRPLAGGRQQVPPLPPPPPGATRLEDV